MCSMLQHVWNTFTLQAKVLQAEMSGQPAEQRQAAAHTR